MVSLHKCFIGPRWPLTCSEPVSSWISGLCRAEEIFQEFIKCLSHSQTLDRTGSMRSRRQLLPRNVYSPIQHRTHSTHSSRTFVISSQLHRDPGRWWKGPDIAHHPCPMSRRELSVFLLWLWADMLRWSAIEHGDVIFQPWLVTAQGVYCHPKVSYSKCHSQKHKRQDAAPCTCSVRRRRRLSDLWTWGSPSVGTRCDVRQELLKIDVINNVVKN